MRDTERTKEAAARLAEQNARAARALLLRRHFPMFADRTIEEIEAWLRCTDTHKEWHAITEDTKEQQGLARARRGQG